MSTTTSDILKTAVALIEIQSIDEHPKSLRKVIDRVGDFFVGAPVHINAFEHEGYPSLVITTRKTQSPEILLHGHLDVVPGLPAQFQPHLENGRLFGRGAVDMKGFVAVAMHALRDLAHLTNPPDIGLMLNTDEEIGGRNGARQMVAEGWSAGQLINGDGGYGNAVTFAQKGIVQLTVELDVEPGSRNAPWEGIGAADQFVRLLAMGIGNLCPHQEQLTELDNWGTTATILSLESHSDDNLPPKKATASVRVYWADENTGEEIIGRARDAFHPARVSGSVQGERVYLPQTNPDLMRLREIWQHHLEQPVGYRADNGSSDAKWFADLGIPILILRLPGGGAHEEREWLETSSLVPMYKTLVQYINEKANASQTLPPGPLKPHLTRAVFHKS